MSHTDPAWQGIGSLRHVLALAASVLALQGCPGTSPTPDAGAVPCGGAGQACCFGKACNDGLTCDPSAVCDAICGDLGQACCNGTACNSGLLCTSGDLCEAAGSDGGSTDAGNLDAGAADAGSMDAGNLDAGSTDGGTEPQDAGPVGDAGITDGGVDGGLVEVDSTTYPALTPDVPQVRSFGGPVLGAPVVVPVFFVNDDPTIVAQIAQFLSSVGSSTYWSTIATEYSVGALTAATPFLSSDMPTGTLQDQDVQNWLSNEINTDPTFPQPTANTLYALHYPSGVVIDRPNGDGTSAVSCQDFAGYHLDIALPPTESVHPDAGSADGGTLVVNPEGVEYAAYAVIPRCANFESLAGIDAITGQESQQLIDSSTDPYPDFDPAYAQVDGDHIIWEVALGGGEVADLCAQNPGAFTKFAGLDFTVQRSWSNTKALAGHDPCQPDLPGEIYFNTMPVLLDHGIVSVEGVMTTYESVNVPLGTTQSILLDLFSDGPTTSLGGAWSVQVEDLSQLQGAATPNVDYTLSPVMGVNGNQLVLTIAPKKAGPYGFNIFLVTSTLGGFSNLWVGAVGN